MEIGTQDIRPVRSQNKTTRKEATPSPQEEPKMQDYSHIDFRNLYIPVPPFLLLR